MHLSISTVTPVYSGEAYLGALIQEIAKFRQHLADAQIPLRLQDAIFVVDEAIDGSATTLEKLKEQYDFVRIIYLSKNFGQHPATIAGILHTSSDWVVTLDEDLQHRPDEILKLLKLAILDQQDIIYATPQEHVHQNPVRDLGSRFFKKFIKMATANKHVPLFNSFRLIRGSIARAAASVCAHETYFDISLTWFTQRINAIELVLKDDRFIKSGKSGYSFRRLLSHARRMVISGNAKILRTFGYIGILASVASVLCIIYTVFMRLYNPESIPVIGWASLFVTILFFGGMISVMLSILTEYLTNVMLHTHGKPVFFTVDRANDKILKSYFEKS